MSPKTNNWW